ncbi:MAG: hypothetical protein ACMUHB_04310 [Thermoplasmatota archaeon]
MEMSITDFPATELPLDAASSITDNIVLIAAVAAVSIIIIGALTILNNWDKLRNRVRLDELEAKKDKLQRYANYQKRRSLRDAVTMLDPEERAHLYSIWEDNAIVSRKALFKLNELEDRLRRAERGSELRWAESRIGTIRETEKKIFPEAFPKTKGGRK